MDFIFVFSKVIVIFMLILIGYITVKRELVSSKGQQELTNLLLNVFLPCALLRTFQVPFDTGVFKSGIQILILMAAIYIVTIGLAIVLSKYISTDAKKQAVLVLGMVLPNVGFMGYPFIEAVLGSDYIFYAVMGNIVYEIISWGIMVNLLVKRSGMRIEKNFVQRLVSTPPMIAIALGLFIHLSPFRMPEMIFSTIHLLGNAMTSVAILIVGMSLANADLKKVFMKKELYVAASVRLLVFPLLAGLILRFLGFKELLLVIPTILVSMPSGGYTSILSGKYGLDSTYGAEIITVCTLLSVVTIPLVLMIII